MTYRVDPERSQWLTADYRCGCYRVTEDTMDGGIRMTVFCCRECRERAEFLLEQRVLQLDEPGVTEHEQLCIEMNGVVDPPAPAST